MERWDAQGNVYLVGEPFGATAERVHELVGDADGILEVSPAGEVTIWNPDGSRAEMSGTLQYHEDHSRPHPERRSRGQFGRRAGRHVRLSPAGQCQSYITYVLL